MIPAPGFFNSFLLTIFIKLYKCILINSFHTKNWTNLFKMKQIRFRWKYTKKSSETSKNIWSLNMKMFSLLYFDFWFICVICVFLHFQQINLVSIFYLSNVSRIICTNQRRVSATTDQLKSLFSWGTPRKLYQGSLAISICAEVLKTSLVSQNWFIESW